MEYPVVTYTLNGSWTLRYLEVLFHLFRYKSEENIIPYSNPLFYVNLKLEELAIMSKWKDGKILKFSL